jgi:hypothetical protein
MPTTARNPWVAPAGERVRTRTTGEEAACCGRLFRRGRLRSAEEKGAPTFAVRRTSERRGRGQEMSRTERPIIDSVEILSI